MLYSKEKTHRHAAYPESAVTGYTVDIVTQYMKSIVKSGPSANTCHNRIQEKKRKEKKRKRERKKHYSDDDAIKNTFQ